MIGVCITAKDEAGTIGEIISRIGQLWPMSVYVADDGSDDETGLVAREAGAKIVVRHEESRGIGPSLMELWRLALEDGCGRVAQLDAGGSHDPYELPRLVTVDADLVIGTRFAKGGSYVGRPVRRYLSRLATAMCNFAQVGANYSDWTSGYRVFSPRAVSFLLERRYFARMHGWQIEVLAWAGYAGLSIAEIPITYKASETSFNLRVANEAFSVWLHIFNQLGRVKRQR